MKLKGIIRKCLNCGKEFEPHRFNHVFCTPECHKEHIRKKRKPKLEPKRVCRWCHEGFKPYSRSIFCTPECRRDFHNVKQRLFNLINFDNERLDRELAKLQDLGRNYRFPEKFDEFNSGFYFKELIKHD